MSSTANQQRARKSCEWLETPNLILSTASLLLLIFLFWPPVARAQLFSPSPHSSGIISGTVLLAEENRPAGGLRVQVKSFAGGLPATAVTDSFAAFRSSACAPGPITWSSKSGASNRSKKQCS